MPYKIVRNDITKMKVDAIVNAANKALMPGGGVCGAIFSAAGTAKLTAACAKIGGCPTGQAVITEGFKLPAKYIIHTPGPVYKDGNRGEAELLRSCYISSLNLAEEYGLNSVAFPLISSGIYGYPKDEALRIATDAITDFLVDHETEVYLVVFDKASYEISSKLYDDVKEYIEDNMTQRFEQRNAESMSAKYLSELDAYLPKKPHNREESEFDDADTEFIGDKCAAPFIERKEGAPKPLVEKKLGAPAPLSAEEEIENRIKNMDKSFSQRLFDLIDERGLTDVQVYKKANVDRKLFSKIRTNANYKPAKVTAVAFALALNLNVAEARDLIGRAGYSLTRSNKFDIIIEYFITRGEYNIFEINEVLFAFDQPLIGA